MLNLTFSGVFLEFHVINIHKMDFGWRKRGNDCGICRWRCFRVMGGRFIRRKKERKKNRKSVIVVFPLYIFNFILVFFIFQELHTHETRNNNMKKNEYYFK